MVDPRYFAPADIAGAYARGLQIRQQREQAEGQRRLGDLLPTAMGMPGGGIDESGATQGGRDAAMREIAHINPELFMKLSDRQREQANSELSDLSAAVRWADTPEKWTQVQQFYAAHGHPEAQQYGFDSRESVLLQLGKMGEYLKGEPKPEYRTVEAGGSLIDVSGGQPRVVIAPNDGSYQTGQPVQGGGGLPRVTDQQSYDAVPPGAQYMTPDGHVRVKGGQSGGGSTGGFPY